MGLPGTIAESPGLGGVWCGDFLDHKYITFHLEQDGGAGPSPSIRESASKRWALAKLNVNILAHFVEMRFFLSKNREAEAKC